MQLIGGLLLCVLVGLVACDYECFKNSVVECQKNILLKNKPPNQDFCNLHPQMVKCQYLASVECKTGFEASAKDALAVVNALCKEGTPVNNALKNDKQCNFDTIMKDSADCAQEMNKEMKKIRPGPDPSIEANRIMCRFIDGIKDCLLKKFKTQCSELVQIPLLKVTMTSVIMQKKICTLLPPVKG